ncbi:MAG: LytTR family transcriptional regulator DNA-binding domain-containing protein, partial [Saprospiraceae bacterium]
KQKFVIKRTLKDLIARLPKGFMRVHQSYIVNLSHIKKMEDGMVYLEGHQVPWGKNYRACALRRIQQIAI